MIFVRRRLITSTLLLIRKDISLNENLNLKMAMESVFSLHQPGTSSTSHLIPDEYQHLHGVKIDALKVDGAGIHVDGGSVRISLPRHLMKSCGGEVNMSRIQESHRHHRMMRRTHDWRWGCFAWWWSRHRLLNVWLVCLHCVLLSRWCWWCRWWWAHVWFGLDSTFNTRSADGISAFLKLQP